MNGPRPEGGAEDPAMTLGGILRQARARLRAASVEGADLDARLIVEHISGLSQANLIARPNAPVGPETLRALEDALTRRLAGEPVHRIFGVREFFGLALHLSPETLEPRPDTETLVELALPFVKARAEERGTCNIVDLGTGTGAIAIALIAGCSRARATGSDVSDGALATAASNAEGAGVASRLRLVRSNWWESIGGRFDLIVSNPPYIPTGDIDALQREVRLFDPLVALDGGADGLAAYRAIAAGAAGHLEEGGRIALEIGIGQRGSVEEIFDRAGFGLAETALDLAGIERALMFTVDA